MNTIFECSYFFFGCEMGNTLNTYATGEMNGGHSKCVPLRTGGDLHLHLHLFSCFCLIVSCFICRNLTLPSFKKGVFVRNGYFSPMRSISVVMK